MARLKNVQRKKQVQGIVFRRDGYQCFWCGCEVHLYLLNTSNGLGVPDDGATLDHVIPVAAGGSNRIDNLVTACRACNERRGDTPATTFVAESPRVPA